MINRRDFVTRSAGVVASASTMAGLNGGYSILAGSPNETIRVAVVGVRGQGNAHIREYLRMPNVEIAALCDIDPTVLNQRLGEIEKASGKRPKAYSDLRKVLEDKSIDAISVATPNHWHSLMGICGCQAG